MARPLYSPVKDIDLYYSESNNYNESNYIECNHNEYNNLNTNKKKYSVTFTILFSIFSTLSFAYFLQKYF